MGSGGGSRAYRPVRASNGPRTPPRTAFCLEAGATQVLDGRDQEDLPQVVQKLNYGDPACKGSRTEIKLRLRNTLNNIQQSGFSWVRLLFGPGGFKIYANRCNLDLSKVYPAISPQYVEEFNHLLQIIGEYNLNIELVLSGSKGFHDLKHDLQFFESVLTQLDMTHIKLIMLGGDVQPANNKRHATWLKTMFDVFARNPAYSHTPFSFAPTLLLV